ncbi:hypothetical protein LO762_07610 [Actinocorallia sp. API 0066]|uniref:hypothetical protein n=1 Tax=Actinocorallia sp. API 0066 TaxID=2896846 RepID=UPI001E5368B7|nr:hypothetical protein [Actinocorallia sp. API 0066]MCD0449055.1 hypothetical protein [Actinocorallia sp. API 0066]
MHPALDHERLPFPLIGWGRPPCTPLPQRLDEIVQGAAAAHESGADALHHAAHALNKAALLASDTGLPDLATDLCWRHINAYRTPGHPLTVHQARYQLEPVINLARLRMRAADGQAALDLFTALYRAAADRHDLAVDGRLIPLTGLTGTAAEYRELVQSLWLQLVGDGVRALTSAGRWDDAVAHARSYRGIGLHPREGRQALIVSHFLVGGKDQAHAALAQTIATEPWERIVLACLTLLVADPGSSTARTAVSDAATALADHPTDPIFVVFRIRAALAAAALAEPTAPIIATSLRSRAANDAARTGDGYAAREVLRRHHTAPFLSTRQADHLDDLTRTAGLGAGSLDQQLHDRLLATARSAETLISTRALVS